MTDIPREDPRPAARPAQPERPTEDVESSNSNFTGGDIKPRRWRPGCFSIVFGLFALIIGYGVVSGNFGDSDYLELETTCQMAVRENLKSPSSAKFIGVPVSDGTYIRGEVDAQNSFGAVIRNSFRCTIIDSETVRLDYIR
jgi:hypothetical protein